MTRGLLLINIKAGTPRGNRNFTRRAAAEFDLVMVTAAHTNVDYEMIQRNALAIFDTKNVMKNIENRDNIEVL